MKKVLIISYLFPPAGGGGVIRTTKFVKYLPQFDWQVYILAPKKAFYPIEDKSLLKEIPKEVEIIRVKYFEPGFWFSWRYWQSLLKYFLYPWLLVPDNQAFWILPAVIAGYRLIKKEKIKLIYTSAAPYSDHLVGWILKKLTGVKWVADFRDEWTSNPFIRYPTKLHYWLNRFWEKKVISSADQVIAVSWPIVEHFKSLSSKRNKFATLTNGFDQEDFSGPEYRRGKNFKILYAGTLYNDDSLYLFEAALRQLKLKNIKLDYLGLSRRVSHSKAIREIQQADLLLFILDPIYRPGVITGKLFEYLAAKRPILGLAPQDTEAVKLIKKFQAGLVAHPQHITEIKEKIKIFYSRWQKNSLYLQKRDLSIYERKNLTRRLGQIFEEISGQTRAIKLCFVGNLASPQNQGQCRELLKKNYEIHFITTKPARLNGIKTYLLPKKNFLPLYFLDTVIKIRQLVKKIKPDILHGEDLVFAGIWTYLSGFHPYVVTPWGSDINNYETFIGPEKYLIRKMLKSTDLLTANSIISINKAVRLGLPKKRGYLNHFGVDLEKFIPQPIDKLKRKYRLDQKKIIFCPRSIAPIYNIDILIKAFKRLSKVIPSILIFSTQNLDNDYFGAIQKLIKENYLQNRVIFEKKIDNDQMPLYYSLADVVVSIASSDGCSSSFLEAMAMGSKIVTTDLANIQEWRRGNNLFLVPVRDVEKTFLALKKAIQYPKAAWRKFAKINRQLIYQKAELNQNINQLDALYRELL